MRHPVESERVYNPQRINVPHYLALPALVRINDRVFRNYVPRSLQETHTDYFRTTPIPLLVTAETRDICSSLNQKEPKQGRSLDMPGYKN